MQLTAYQFKSKSNRAQLRTKWKVLNLILETKLRIDGTMEIKIGFKI